MESIEATENRKNVYWREGYEFGEGGFVVRNDLFKFIQKLEDAGKTPVGLIIDGWNIEVLVEAEDG